MSTSTGAYTFAMASNYNRVPKSEVVAVTGSGVFELVLCTMLEAFLFLVPHL